MEEAAEGARIVWAETPSNPALDVLDIEALARATRRAGALLAVDSTLATPLALRPLELGADLVHLRVGRILARLRGGHRR